ncbi:MAG: Gfo/Idh/MocA family oxidoreductase [Stappiaceae bacterium]
MLRWGILGTGFISDTVIEAIKSSSGSELAMIAGRNAERVSEVREAHKFPRYSIGYDAILADPDIDVIYIGLPNHVHHSMTIKAAENGKAVLSEKSLTTTMEQAKALVDGVRTNGTFFLEGLMYLAHPLYRRLSELLLDGRLGKLRAVNGAYAANIWQVVNPAGGGTLYNLGCYPVSLLHFIVQSMCGDDAFQSRRMQAVGNRSETDGNICDTAVTVRFENGVLANLQSTDSYGMAYDFSIFGEKGVLRFITNPWHPLAGRNHLQWCPYNGPCEDIFIDDANDAFYYQIKLVEAALTAGKKEADRPSPRLEDSLEIMAFLTEWEASCDP